MIYGELNQTLTKIKIMSASEHSSDEEFSRYSSENDEDNLQRQKIRDNLSTLSFEELIKLKEKLGSKVYNATVYGAGTKTKKSSKELKRTNKNRPREISSKLRPKQIRTMLGKDLATVAKTIPKVPRDPRFDPSCGDFNKETFKQNYEFVNEIKQNERGELQKELNECTDAERRKTIKLLIQRMDNQTREEGKTNKLKEKEVMEKQQIKERIKQGQKPEYKKKSVKKMESLVEKYEELKKTNSLRKHIEKRTKKLKVKDRKVMQKIK